MPRVRPNTKQGLPTLGGKFSYAQLQDIWVINGGDPKQAAMAAAIAMAESNGDPNATNHNSNGTTDRGLWQVNSIHGAQSTYDPNANARAAVSISGNGKDWSPWTTFRTGAYRQFLGATAAGLPAASGVSTGKAISGGGAEGGGGGPSFLTVLKDLVTGNVGDLALILAKAAITVIKDVTLGIADYIVIPWWHWNQRAVQYYISQELFSNTSAGWVTLPWTAAFWGIGYRLLFTDPDRGNWRPAPVRSSRVARHVRGLQLIPARQSLVKPKDVKEKTLRKPAPVISRASITRVDTMRVTRRMPVRVEGGRVPTSPSPSPAPRKDDNVRTRDLPIGSETAVKRAGTIAPTEGHAAITPSGSENGQSHSRNRTGNSALSRSRGIVDQSARGRKPQRGGP